MTYIQIGYDYQLSYCLPKKSVIWNDRHLPICFISLIILGVAVFLFIIIKKPEAALEIEHIKFIDILLKVQIVICLIMGIFLIFIIGIIVLYLFIVWSVLTGILYIIFAIKGKKFIGIIKSNELIQD